MAQVILKKSSVAARVPVAGDLVYGELAINYQDGLLYYKKADNTIGSLGGSSNVISVNTTTDAFRITQIGTGNALVVEDATNPDATPFVIDNAGKVLIARSVASIIANGALQITVQGATLPGVMTNTGATTYRPHWTLAVLDTEIASIGTTNTTLSISVGGAVRASITSAGGVSFGSTGTAYGTAGQILQSNGNASPTWVTSSGGGGGTTTGIASAYTRTSYTSTAGQTEFSATYTVGFVEVFYNGVLLNSSDYTATDTIAIILNTAANLNDIIEIIAYPAAVTPSPVYVNIAKQNNTVTVAGSNTFSIVYTVGYLDVYVNGIKLTAVDFTATNGTTVVIPDLLVDDTVELVSVSTSVMSTVGTGLSLASGVLTINSAATATANTIVLRDGTGQVLTTGIKFSDNSIQTTASVPGVTTGKSIAMAIIFGG